MYRHSWGVYLVLICGQKGMKRGDGGDYSIPASKNFAVKSQAEGIGPETLNQFFFLFSGEGTEFWPDFGKRLNIPGCRATYNGQGDFWGEGETD
jgi:hypothetical protein